MRPARPRRRGLRRAGTTQCSVVLQTVCAVEFVQGGCQRKGKACKETKQTGCLALVCGALYTAQELGRRLPGRGQHAGRDGRACTLPKLSKYCRKCSSVTVGGMRATKMRDERCGGPPRGRASFGCAARAVPSGHWPASAPMLGQHKLA